jgi:hypothetical protein
MNREKNKALPVLTFKLMLKQHWETGINYLCITKRDNWYDYTGSGSRWKILLNAHESEILTHLLFTTDSLEEFTIACEYYSNLFDVVNNEDFANVVPELGYEGNQGNLPEWWKTASEEDKVETRKKIKNSREKTCLEKYGETNTLRLARECLNEYVFETYGVENIMQVQEFADKCRESAIETLLEKYGVDHNMKIPDVALKVAESRKRSLFEKYGVEYYLQVDGVAEQVKNKRENTMMRKYGVPNISMVPEHKETVGKLISDALQKRKEETCEFCDFVSKNIQQHTIRCKFNPNKVEEEKVECPWCTIIVDKRNAGRWHFDNCKFKKVD